jgi:integrase
MATINVHQAKDGTKTFRVRIRRKGEPTQTASFSSLKDAKRYATMIEGQMLAGKHFPAKKPTHTLSELLERYTQEIMPRKAPETQRSHRAAVVFWQERLGHKRLVDLTRTDIITQRDNLSKTVAPATVQKYLVILTHALNIAIREYEWISTNIAATISRPPLPPPRQRYLSDAERSRLLAECRRSINQHLYALVLVALSTSLRRGSLFALTTKNTDVRTGTISLEITKNGRGVVLPLVGEALEIVRRLTTSSKDGYLFPRGKGDPWCHYRAAWEHAVKRANRHYRF